MADADQYADLTLPAKASKTIHDVQTPVEAVAHEFQYRGKPILSLQPLITQDGVALTIYKHSDTSKFITYNHYWVYGHIHMASWDGSPVIMPTVPGQGGIGNTGVSWGYSYFDLSATVLGSAIDSATTIAPTKGMHVLNGTTDIQTITIPLGGAFVGTIVLIPNAAASFVTGGNIQRALTATANVPVLAICNGTNWWLK